MLPAHRRAKIKEKLTSNGYLHASELAASLNISEDTIRRDLIKLEQEGQLKRVRGGALPKSGIPINHQEREFRACESKKAIAIEAVKLIGNTSCIALDGGTTTLEIAKYLPEEFCGVVVTNNLPAAIVLAKHPNANVVVLGGRLFKSALDTVGAKIAEDVQKMRFDICFVGAASVDAMLGFGSIDYEEVQTKRVLIKSADRVVCTASAEKIGTSSSFIYASSEEVTDLITDGKVSIDVVNSLKNCGVNVIIAAA